MATTDKVVWLDQGWQPVAIGFCPSEAAWDREAKRWNISADYPSIAGWGGHTALFNNSTTHQNIILVTVGRGSERDAMEVISTIVHEAVHVWQFVRQVIGEDNPGIEMEAYAIQNITENLVDAYCQTQGKGKVWA
ncbi:hypothetical protein [Shinella fusca]|uniref:Uncharacterized protein n=1 Tax=Shinella fusca TaxID=544480 RepID=A0A7W7YR50_9HYPH|nr:hypothetical protein [Shinella fusca]MBB5040816.1 hypothetical protein [Shinella fusca]